MEDERVKHGTFTQETKVHDLYWISDLKDLLFSKGGGPENDLVRSLNYLVGFRQHNYSVRVRSNALTRQP